MLWGVVTSHRARTEWSLSMVLPMRAHLYRSFTSSANTEHLLCALTIVGTENNRAGNEKQTHTPPPRLYWFCNCKHVTSAETGMDLKINLVPSCSHLVARKRTVHLTADGASDSVLEEVFLHTNRLRGPWPLVGRIDESCRCFDWPGVDSPQPKMLLSSFHPESSGQGFLISQFVEIYSAHVSLHVRLICCEITKPILLPETWWHWFRKSTPRRQKSPWGLNLLQIHPSPSEWEEIKWAFLCFALKPSKMGTLGPQWWNE